jgi:hypothetical protein
MNIFETIVESLLGNTARCDFCGTTELEGAKTYACEPFAQRNVQYDGRDWEACEECARFIDQDDWAGLLDRFRSQAPETLPGWEMLPRRGRQIVIENTRALFREFKQRRLNTN